MGEGIMDVLINGFNRSAVVLPSQSEMKNITNIVFDMIRFGSSEIQQDKILSGVPEYFLFPECAMEWMGF